MVFFDQLFQGCFCFFYLILRCGWINDYRIQYFSGRIYYCQLTACTECRIPAEHGLSCNRRLHEKLLKILSKYTDCSLFCLLGQKVTDLTLDGRCDQAAVTVFYHFFQRRRCDWIIPCNHTAFQIT